MWHQLLSRRLGCGKIYLWDHNSTVPMKEGLQVWVTRPRHICKHK